MLDEVSGNLVQLVDVGAKELFCLSVSVVDNLKNKLVNLSRGSLGIILGSAVISAEEHASALAAIVNAAELLGHTVLGNHCACGLGCLFDVVGSACRDIVENKRLCNTSAEGYDNILLHLPARVVGLILGRQGHCVAACHTARNDGDFVDGILSFEHVKQNSVTCLVIRGQLLFLLAHNLGLLLGSHNNLDCSFLNLLHCDSLFIGTCRKQCRLVEQVFKVRAGKACGCLCDSL